MFKLIFSLFKQCMHNSIVPPPLDNFYPNYWVDVLSLCNLYEYNTCYSYTSIIHCTSACVCVCGGGGEFANASLDKLTIMSVLKLYTIINKNIFHTINIFCISCWKKMFWRHMLWNTSWASQFWPVEECEFSSNEMDENSFPRWN